MTTFGQLVLDIWLVGGFWGSGLLVKAWGDMLLLLPKLPK